MAPPDLLENGIVVGADRRDAPFSKEKYAGVFKGAHLGNLRLLRLA